MKNEEKQTKEQVQTPKVGVMLTHCQRSAWASLVQQFSTLSQKHVHITKACAHLSVQGYKRLKEEELLPSEGARTRRGDFRVSTACL